MGKRLMFILEGKSDKMAIVLKCKNVTFFHSQDEAAFFEWLKKMPYIACVKGSRNILFIEINEALFDNAALHAIVASLRRYKIDLGILEPLVTQDRAELFEWSKQSTHINVYPRGSV
jgi:hypothetical protein